MHATAGYKRADPVGGQLILSSEIGAQASPADIEQAKTDIDCKKRTDFIARANASHVDHAQTLIAKNRAALRQVEIFYAKATAKAD